MINENHDHLLTDLKTRMFLTQLIENTQKK